MNNALNPNPLVRLLDKEPKSFTKQDLIKVVEEFDVEMINFHYVAGDGRLKTLNFIIQDYEHLNSVLSVGESEQMGAVCLKILMQEQAIYMLFLSIKLLL